MPLTLNKVKKQVAHNPQVIEAVVAIPTRLGGGIGPIEDHGQAKDEKIKEQIKNTMTSSYFIFSIAHPIIDHSFSLHPLKLGRNSTSSLR